MTYQINAKTFTEASEQLLAQFKQQNPAMSKFTSQSSDGKLVLTVGEPKKKAKKAKKVSQDVHPG